LEGGSPRSLPKDFQNLLAYDFSDRNERNIDRLAEYVRQHQIQLVFIYDIQPIDPLFKPLRQAGTRAIISFWGAPIASRAPGWKNALKRLQIVLSRSKVDCVIFESQAMADLGIRFRGIPPRMVKMIYNGVDPSIYRPEPSTYVYGALNIPADKKIIIYAGHMEPRKGLPTLVDSAIELLHHRQRKDVCFVICGNRGDESKVYEGKYAPLGIAESIRFGGYRSDLAKIYPSCFCGVIPSSGWDSFPRSPIEMASSGLPVIAARLQGLPESVLDRRTGLLFEPGNAAELANCIETLLDHPELAKEYGRNGRKRCETELSRQTQLERLIEVCRERLGQSQATATAAS
jgi:glycosyltransferase involved in cell wall biosynthesis